jgi:hypothetical protein
MRAVRRFPREGTTKLIANLVSGADNGDDEEDDEEEEETKKEDEEDDEEEEPVWPLLNRIRSQVLGERYRPN